MARVASARVRTAVLAASVIVSAIVTWVSLGWRHDDGTTLMIDRTEEIGRLLEERRAQGGVARGGGSLELAREPLERSTAETLFAPLKYWNYEYDPHVYFKRVAGYHVVKPFAELPGGQLVIATNNLGMREDQDVLDERPDLRILVAGDSQTEGVCANTDSVPNVLERLLADRRPGETVEVLNAAVGAYGPYNYLGTLECYAKLQPDVFVVVLYGGNDFYDMMRLQRYFNRRPQGRSAPCDLRGIADELRPLRIMAAQFTQLCYFLNNPGDVPIAIDTAAAIAREVARLCDEIGASPLFVYMPGPMIGQPELYGAETRAFLDAAGLEREALGVFDALADGYLECLDELGLSHVDLRPAFRAADERLFWEADRHLNLDGNRLVARTLLDSVAVIVEARASAAQQTE